MTVLSARWHGDLPKPGEYLKTKSNRSRYAYLLVAIEPLKALPHHLPGVVRAKFLCVRVRPHTIPSDAIVHPWKWDARKKVARPGVAP